MTFFHSAERSSYATTDYVEKAILEARVNDADLKIELEFFFRQRARFYELMHGLVQFPIGICQLPDNSMDLLALAKRYTLASFNCSGMASRS